MNTDKSSDTPRARKHFIKMLISKLFVTNFPKILFFPLFFLGGGVARNRKFAKAHWCSLQHFICEFSQILSLATTPERGGAIISTLRPKILRLQIFLGFSAGKVCDHVLGWSKVRLVHWWLNQFVTRPMSPWFGALALSISLTNLWDLHWRPHPPRRYC